MAISPPNLCTFSEPHDLQGIGLSMQRDSVQSLVARVLWADDFKGTKG